MDKQFKSMVIATLEYITYTIKEIENGTLIETDVENLERRIDDLKKVFS